MTRSARFLPWLALATLLACALAPASPARAEIRQQVLVDLAPDIDTLLAEFDVTVRESGFQLYLSIDETRTVPHNGVSLSFRHVDYNLNHSDGRSITASFFMLTEPDREAFEALQNYVIYNYGYGSNTAVRLRELGTLSWYEWSPQGTPSMQTLEQDLSDWRERYVEIE